MSRPWLRMDLTPLATRDFRLLFASGTVTQLGTQATAVALVVQVKQLTGAAFAVGLLGAAELVPLVAFALYGGVLADRLDRRRIIRWCEAALGGCAVLLLADSALSRPPLWPLYAITAVMTALAALQGPALEASIPRVVPRDQLTAAAALLSSTQNHSFIVGGTLGGVLAAGPEPLAVYGADAVSFAVSFGLLCALRPLPPAAAAGPARRPERWSSRSLLSYALGPSAGQLRAGTVASLTTTRVALTLGGLLCVGAVGLVSRFPRSRRTSAGHRTWYRVPDPDHKEYSLASQRSLSRRQPPG